LCALLVLAQILAFAHGALASHQTCLEHGEAIHAGSHPSSTTSSTKPASGLALAAPSLEAEGHGHEHCGAMAHRRAKLALPLPALGGVLDLQRVVNPWVETTQSLIAGPALLFLAPKGSPPVA